MARLKRELAWVTKERDLIKRRGSVLREAITERCAVIERCRSDHLVGMMCCCLEVSTSGFYAWIVRQPGPHARANARLLTRIRDIHEDSKGIIGAHRMQEDLGDEVMPASVNRGLA